MLVEEVDGVHLQPVQHRINDFSDVFGTAVEPATALPSLRVDVKAEFRRDDHLIAKRRERFANEFFVREWAICLCRIEEGHATLEPGTNDLDAVLTRYRRTIGRRQSHASVPESRDFKIALTQLALLHFSSWPSVRLFLTTVELVMS